MDLNESWSRGSEMGHRRFPANPSWAPLLVQSLLIYLNVAKYIVLIIPFPAILTTVLPKTHKSEKLERWKSSCECARVHTSCRIPGSNDYRFRWNYTRGFGALLRADLSIERALEEKNNVLKSYEVARCASSHVSCVKQVRKSISHRARAQFSLMLLRGKYGREN